MFHRIRFEQGPIPSEVATFYKPEELLPTFEERYPGEFADTYRANGLVNWYGLFPFGGEITLAQASATIDPEVIRAGKDMIFGPAGILPGQGSGRLVLGGLGLYTPIYE